MSVIPKIFKGKIDAQGAFENVMDKIDDSKLTAEEANRINMEKADKVMEFAEKTADENSIRSKSRRFVAYGILVNLFAAFWLVCILYLLGKVELGDAIKSLAIEWKFITVFIMVAAFYFGGYYANGLVERMRKPKKEKK